MPEDTDPDISEIPDVPEDPTTRSYEQLMADLLAARPSWSDDPDGPLGRGREIASDEIDLSFPRGSVEFSDDSPAAQSDLDPSREYEEGGEGGETFLHPFKLMIRQDPDTEDWEWSCHTGRLYTNPDMGTLDIGRTGIIPGTGTWNALTGTTVIWIEVEFDTDGTTPLSVELKSGSSPWPGSPKAGAYTGTAPNEKQTFAYRQIGSIAAVGYWVIDQMAFTNYILRVGCWENKPLIEAVPY